MGKGTWVRVADVLETIEHIIDRAAKLTVDRWLRTKTDAEIERISEQMSFGWRGFGKEDPDKTQRRELARVMILLAYVRNEPARVNAFANLRTTKTKSQIETDIGNYWGGYHPPAHNDPAPDLPAAATRTWQQRLTQDGLDMLAHMSVTPPHDGQSAVPNVQNDFTTREVILNRVQYTRLIPNPLQRGALNLDPKNANPGGQLPIYWLPWKNRHIVKLDLLSGHGTPDVFFTSAIGGCSVFAQGPPNHPIAYHAGLDDPLPTVTANDIPVPALRPIAKRGDSAAFWHGLLEANEHLNIQTAGIGEVSKNDYVFDGSMWNKTKATKRVLSFIKRMEELYEDSGMKVTYIIPFGCVFGLKVGYNWRFYLQENLTMQYRETKVRPVRKWTATFPLELHQVFPRPAQRVSMIPKFCYMPGLFVASERVFQVP